MIRLRLALICSISDFARTTMRPRPVRYASATPMRPMMMPPVGKSGPGMYCMRSSTDMSGLSIMAQRASVTSPRLWGGMLVAMPTAMPPEPLTSRLGNRAGSTAGCCRVSSKLGTKSTVSLSMSAIISVASLESRASVYRMAAAPSPSTEPKLPWPSTNRYRVLKGWARRTMASYTATSPWGWYLPSTSPTMRALFLKGLSGWRPSSLMEYRIRRWTGLRPSRTSGRARSVMTAMA